MGQGSQIADKKYYDHAHGKLIERSKINQKTYQNYKKINISRTVHHFCSKWKIPLIDIKGYL